MASISQIKLPNNSVYDIKAKYDISGNEITNTYLRKDFDTIGHNVAFNSSVDIDDLTAGSLLATGSARFVNGLIGNLTGTASNAPWSGITGKPSTYPPSSHTHGNADITSLDAAKITSGTIDIARLPQGALERLTVVADDTARFKLTSATVQKGDTVKVTATGKMYYVVDDTKLATEAGYEVYAAGTAASVPWSGVTGKPSTYTPASHKQAYTSAELTSYTSDENTMGVTPAGVKKAFTIFPPKDHTHSQYYDATVTRTKNTVLAAPNGSDGTASFRALTQADIPNVFLPKIDGDVGIKTVAGNGKYSYCKIATLVIHNQYINRPVVFEIAGRGRYFGQLQVLFASGATTDPGLAGFNGTNNINFWIKKTATSTWEIYGQYNEVYGSLMLYRVVNVAGSGITVTVNMENIDSLPSGSQQAAWGGTVGYANQATNDSDGNKISNTYLKLSGGTLTGPLHIKSNTGNWAEGIRIHPHDNWCTITLCGTDNTGDTGTSAKTWSIHNKDGLFYIAKNGSSTSASAILSCVDDNVWRMNGNVVLHSGNYNNYAPSKTGTGASGTWGISISGNAATATKATQDSDGNAISSTYLKKSGGTMTGDLIIQHTTTNSNTYGATNPQITFKNSDSSQNLSLIYSDYDSIIAPSSLTLIGNQGGEYLIAPNVKATQSVNIGGGCSLKYDSTLKCLNFVFA